jgi:hypothetical protein
MMSPPPRSTDPGNLATIQILEAIGFAFTLDAGRLRVEPLTSADEMAAALEGLADRLRPPLQLRARFKASTYHGGPLHGCHHYGRPGLVLLVQICRARWAIYQVDRHHHARFLACRPSSQRARTHAARKCPGAPVQVIQNPRIRTRTHRSTPAHATHAGTPACR